jgi:hypothetical protein
VRRHRSWTAWIAVIALAGACSSGNPTPINTGLTGTIRRGPVMPVCREGVPCDAPMSGSFDVLKDGHRVASFQTDADGHFRVSLAPGTYTVTPTSAGALMNQQSKTVTVGPDGLTSVELSFDTGIR